jgi:hypothetical protein
MSMGENHTPLERLWEEFCVGGVAHPCRSEANRFYRTGPAKNKVRKSGNFRHSNKRHLRTTIHHTITTNPPANYHQKTPEFPEPPSKTPAKQQKNGSPPPEIFNVKFGFS